MRNVFLPTIAEHAPEVLEHLHKIVFPFYVDVLHDHPQISWYELTLEMYDPYLCTNGLILSMRQWSQRWNLTADWCFELAFRTIEKWTRPYNQRNKLMWDNEGWGGGVPDEWPIPPDGLPFYNPLDFHRSQYKERLHKQVIESIKNDSILRHGEPSSRKAFVDSIIAVADGYCSKVDKYAESLGYKKTREKKKLKQHLVWAVRFQVLSESYSAIAEQERVSVSTVKRAVADILELIELTPRPSSKPGRQRGRKDSPDSPRQLRKQRSS